MSPRPAPRRPKGALRAASRSRVAGARAAGARVERPVWGRAGKPARRWRNTARSARHRAEYAVAQPVCAPLRPPITSFNVMMVQGTCTTIKGKVMLYFDALLRLCYTHLHGISRLELGCRKVILDPDRIHTPLHHKTRPPPERTFALSAGSVQSALKIPMGFGSDLANSASRPISLISRRNMSGAFSSRRRLAISYGLDYASPILPDKSRRPTPMMNAGDLLLC